METPTLIVGAGPAGLAVAGRMRQAGLEFVTIEKSDRVGDAWHRHYDRLHLHSGLFFVGFDNHRPGGVLGTVFEESKTVVDQIKGT